MPQHLLVVHFYPTNAMSPSITPDDLHRIFKNLDKNNNGLITVNQLHHLLCQIRIPSTLKDVENLVGRSSLDYIDFLFFYEVLTKSATTTTAMTTLEQDYESDLAQAFRVFDENNDGYISSQELQSVLLRLELWDGRDCKDMIRVYDQNRDGLLDFEEFKNMMMCDHRSDSCS